MTSNQLFALAALRTGRSPEEVREIFSVIASIIHEKISQGEHVRARPLAVFRPAAPTGRPGKPRAFDARPFQGWKKEVKKCANMN
ncbi:hypothetical protein PTH_2503 [Pelotomaculum thermopropionicum SI]|uniref:Bacterial nucleoid DNA-binding protein n=1 Tax=Pelotomaculum thermopropionicum (strain DSM 13744 / JCM 10971 / SI) TaxID=370438 RepID=A5CZB5_PELTS|nr:hypothetical protein PTH_2503 [Pelotomaculum thermopropionicum SI]